jgi:hypothetical protein
MEKEVRRHQKSHLALAIAGGESIAAWAQENGVSERTAFSWAKDPKVRREVEACRRRVVNQAIGRLTRFRRAKAKRARGRALPARELCGRWSVPRLMPLPLVPCPSSRRSWYNLVMCQAQEPQKQVFGDDAKQPFDRSRLTKNL